MAITNYRAMDRLGARPNVRAASTKSDKSSICHSTVAGMDYIRNPRLFKGMGFSLEERQALGELNYSSLFSCLIQLILQSFSKR
jgi:hypothetical protein